MPLIIEKILLEIEQPAIFFSNFSIIPQEKKYKKTSFLELKDDFIENTYTDNDEESQISNDFNSEEKKFIENSSPEYLNSVLNSENETVVQNGLIKKLNMILLNLMLNDNNNKENNSENKHEELLLLKENQKINSLEKTLSSLNNILMNVTHENSNLKSKIQDLEKKISEPQKENAKIQTNNETKSQSSNINASKNWTVLSSKETHLNFTEIVMYKITMRFFCLKAGSSKIRLHFIPHNLFNPFLDFAIEWTKFCSSKNITEEINKPNSQNPSKKQNNSNMGRKNKTHFQTPNIISSINGSIVCPEIDHLFIYLSLNSSNKTKTQKIESTRLLPSSSQGLFANISNINDLSNFTLTSNERKNVEINFFCYKHGNFSMSLVLTLVNKNLKKMIYYNFTKICYSPDFGLTVFSKKPKSAHDEGDVISHDKIQKDYIISVSKNQSSIKLFVIGKKISNNSQYILRNEIVSNNSRIGNAFSVNNEFLVNKKNNKNMFEISFKCFKTGYFISYATIKVKGYRDYSFMLKKYCEIKIISWYQKILKSKVVVWIFLFSILLILIYLLLKENFNLQSTKQDLDPPIEPNEAALSLIYDLKIKK